jgi:hypothetical protein
MTAWEQGILNPIVILAGGHVGVNGTSAKKIAQSRCAHLLLQSIKFKRHEI